MPARVLIAKPGLDGHDRGAHLVARILRDAGHEVIYSGLRQEPAYIARVAVDEDVDVVGLSVLSGAHLALAAAVREALDELGGRAIAIVLGGVIPDEDVPLLLEQGVAAVLGPGAGSEEVVSTVAAAIGRTDEHVGQ